MVSDHNWIYFGQVDGLKGLLCVSNRGKVGTISALKLSKYFKVFERYFCLLKYFKMSQLFERFQFFENFCQNCFSFIGANGITLSGDGSTVYVNDPADKLITVMARNKVFVLEFMRMLLLANHITAMANNKGDSEITHIRDNWMWEI